MENIISKIEKIKYLEEELERVKRALVNEECSWFTDADGITWYTRDAVENSYAYFMDDRFEDYFESVFENDSDIYTNGDLECAIEHAVHGGIDVLKPHELGKFYCYLPPEEAKRIYTTLLKEHILKIARGFIKFIDSL